MSEEKVSLSNRNQPGEEGYTPPAAAVPLPSKGKVYPEGSPLADAEILEVKAMTAKEEDILTSSALLKQGKALDMLLKSCILDRRIDVDQMLSGDRNAALIAIRITGYGQGYSVKVECPQCGEKSDHEFDLAKLPVKPLGADPVQPHSNLFSFTLPISQKTVQFRLMTGADEREMSTVLERQRKLGNGLDQLVTTRLTHQIVSLGAETDRTKISRIVPTLPARDSRELRNYMDRVASGVDMRQEFSCPRCGEATEVDVPMGTEFFWPQS